MHHSCKLAANFSDLGSDILRYYERLLTKNRSITGKSDCVLCACRYLFIFTTVYSLGPHRRIYKHGLNMIRSFQTASEHQDLKRCVWGGGGCDWFLKIHKHCFVTQPL